MQQLFSLKVFSIPFSFFLIYLWCSLRSVLHAYIAEGLPTHHKLSKHGSSQCKCMHVGMCVCSIHPNMKMKRATSNAVVTSVLLSFQKDFFLVAFLRLSGFKLRCYCSRNHLQSENFCGEVSLRAVLSASFHKEPGRITVLRCRNTSWVNLRLLQRILQSKFISEGEEVLE